ncbi:tRNA dimethylallyltransferase 9 [Acorus calamus]|uniref:tRNA dimethylallyltransferase n=1 Tax=Acorus calamus TaxID=4465 RepID=A0AAV9D795_ACOCL|nr:tRNA dimethylallyltransferase 9 [Acorus calamus]
MSTCVGLRTWCLKGLPLRRTPTTFPSLRPQRTLTTTTCSTNDPTQITSTSKKNNNKQKVIVISGPTGAGKSKLALELAKKLDGEIISADSVQVYRGLDIGSAKPSDSDREEVPHHLLDILTPDEDYSAGRFFDDARRATEGILGRGRVPIVAGGTGLYLRWFMYGKPDVPKASLEIASEVYSTLEALQRRGDWDGAVQLVVDAGDSRARSLAMNDWYRLRRSLEIIRATGAPPSAIEVPYDSFRDRTAEPSKELEYDFICFFLSSPRVELYRLIDLRCEEMLVGSPGILSEASWLLDCGLSPSSNSATRAIGYRQAMEYLLCCRESGGRSSPEEFYSFLTEFQKASRNFAKRQMTWFRNETIYHWLNAKQPLERVLEFIYGAYHDEVSEIRVPEWLAMNKDVTGRRETNELKTYRETNELKTYRTKTRHFVRKEDCSHVLDWVRRTQARSADCRLVL